MKNNFKNTVSSKKSFLRKPINISLLCCLLLLLFPYSFIFAQTGCLYKYDPNDRRIFTTSTGSSLTYSDSPGGKAPTSSGNTSPAFYGSQAGGKGSWVSYTNAQCVTPNPSTRSSQFSNCVIADHENNTLYAGYLVNYAVNCDFDDYAWALLLALGAISYTMISKRMIT